MIQLEGIHKYYSTEFNKLHVLKGIDLSINEGEFVSIMGSSGSGKSTLLNILGLLDEYDQGMYKLDDELVQGMSQKKAAQLRNKKIGFVFQSFNLLPFKTAKENVALPLYYQKMPREERQELALKYLERVGLKEWANHYPNQMSGGQQQRVAIARSLITKPKVILADEPTGALDSVTSEEVMDLFRQFNEEGVAFVIVTHEQEIANETSKCIRVRDGLIEN